MNKITIEKAGTVETLTIPDAEIDAVMAELTERFGKWDEFVEGEVIFALSDDGTIFKRCFESGTCDSACALRGRILHTEAEAKARDERDLAEQRLRKAYLAVTGGAEIEGEWYWIPSYVESIWSSLYFPNNVNIPIEYRFATGEQAAAFGRDNGEDLRLMMSV